MGCTECGKQKNSPKTLSSPRQGRGYWVGGRKRIAPRIAHIENIPKLGHYQSINVQMGAKPHKYKKNGMLDKWRCTEWCKQKTPSRH